MLQANECSRKYTFEQRRVIAKGIGRVVAYSLTRVDNGVV
jgi:hypothetical protein